MLKGYKTFAVAIAVTIFGALEHFDFTAFLSADNAGIVTAVIGVAMYLLRGITNTAPLKGDKQMMYLVAFAIFAILAAFFFAVRLGMSKSSYKHAKRVNEELADEAQEWADKPSTDDDFTNRLRERIKQKNKAKNKR